MAAAAERMDELVREYLLFRGFTGALKQLDAEIKADREKGFRVDKIVEQLQQFIQSYDLSALRDYWNYLDRRLFSRLEDVYRPTVNKLKTSLFRYYLVYTVQTNRNDKTQEFFLKQASELQNQVEWKDWFVLPFLPTPDSNPAFATYFSRQWADTFIVSLHNFLSVLFQCMPVPVILNFDAECQRSALVQEENDILRQKLFALQAETYRMKKEELQQQQQEEEESVVHHRLPAYVSNMDRLGDSELDMTRSQRSTAHSLQSRGGFLSSLLSQGKKGPSRSALTTGLSPTQAGGILLGKKEPSNHQSTKGKEVAAGCKDVKSHFPGQPASESSSVPQRQRRLQDHGKERKELLSKVTSQGQNVEKKTETGAMEAETSPELHTEQSETLTKASAFSTEAGGVRQEQPFIVLSQEEYGEHHSSIMHCSCCWAVGLGPFVSMTPKQRRISVKLTSMKTCPAPSLITQLDLAATDTGGRGMNQVPGKLLLWDTKTMKQQLQFSLEPEPIATNCTAFNHNGNLLVTGAADGIIRLFDMQQHECALSWTAHDGEVYSVEFSYDENTVYSIGEDGKFIQWNIHKSGSKVSEYVLPMDATGPFVLSGYSGYKQVQVPRGRLFAFDSEGNYMLTCSSTGGIIYKLNSDEKILESCLSLGGHRAPVVTVDWCTAMDCGTCLTASMDGKIKLTTLLAQKP
ncbi:WD repeat-containing protein 91 isoform X2 [Chelonoidis abingdonii]|uniref:WD repeat-containing protein 91 isoform X2 n=1 Tax=Chelonoidis abingdonii TaxID=106734 RepID=UPI003F4957E1